MKSIPLEFEMLHSFKWFRVEFESISKERNLLMKVTLTIDGDSLPLDTADLPTECPLLYKEIEAAMKNNADTYWSDVIDKMLTNA